MKNHLTHLDAQKNVRMCDKVFPEVMEEMQALILGNVEKKKQKHTLDETIRKTLNKSFHNDDDKEDPKYEAQLRATMMRSQQKAARTKLEARLQSGPGGSSGAKHPYAVPSLSKSLSARQPRVDKMVDPRKKM